MFTIIIGVRAGARTGYVIPGRDGIGGLDLARNSSAAAAVAVVRRRRWIGCAAGLSPLHWRHTACRQEEQWKGREEQWKGHVRVCYDYKSMLGL